MQIDQDPGDYRVQKPDGSWTQRVNKPLCRWLGIMAGIVAAMGAFAPGETFVPGVALMAFFSGGLISLSLKSIDW